MLPTTRRKPFRRWIRKLSLAPVEHFKQSRPDRCELRLSRKNWLKSRRAVCTSPRRLFCRRPRPLKLRSLFREVVRLRTTSTTEVEFQISPRTAGRAFLRNLSLVARREMHSSVAMPRLGRKPPERKCPYNTLSLRTNQACPRTWPRVCQSCLTQQRRQTKLGNSSRLALARRERLRV